MPADDAVFTVSNADEKDAGQLLFPHHLDHLLKSAIPRDFILQRGYRTVTDRRQLEALGFSKQQCRVPGILIPLHRVNGDGIVAYQFRPDIPRLNNRGRPIKYETQAGAINRIDCPPSCRDGLANPGIDLLVTEGLKKADAMASQGECVIALTGIWNWRARNQFGGVTVSPDFDHIALNGRPVLLVPDSDYATNPGVAQAARRLAAILKGKKATVSVVLLPPTDNGEKTGADDFLARGHTMEQLKALAVPFEETEKGPEPKDMERSFFYLKNRIYLEVRRYDGEYGFACLDEQKQVKVTNEIGFQGQVIKPRPLPEIEGRPLPIVGLPDENVKECRLFSPDELKDEITRHLSTYVDLPDNDLELSVYYIIFTWFYSKVDTLGYLRFLADTGKGKSRVQKVVGDISFYPVFASGASTFSGIARLNNLWRGTLIMDEADTKGDKEHQFVKYLNLGFERGKYYVLSDKQNPRVQDFFDPFSPKILAMRQPFNDNATEARLLSISPHETSNPNIPIILPEKYYIEARRLRNEMALFTLHHFDDINPQRLMTFSDLSIEPRLKQLAMPLSIVFQLWPAGEEMFRDYLLSRQKEIRRVRSMSWEGTLVNLLTSFAAGDQEMGIESSEYFDPEKKSLVAVTPSMISQQLKTSVKAVTQGLLSVGVQIEKRWVTVHKDGKETRKQVRAYVIPDSRTWREILSRYYFAEEGENELEIPEVIKSTKFTVWKEASQVSQVSQTKEENGNPVTLVTDVTVNSARPNEVSNKPDHCCYACKSDKWWYSPATGWLCGTCHPNPNRDKEQTIG
jgi:uncharacterized protein YjhX (UPF0386 family)